MVGKERERKKEKTKKEGKEEEKESQKESEKESEKRQEKEKKKKRILVVKFGVIGLGLGQCFRVGRRRQGRQKQKETKID